MIAEYASLFFACYLKANLILVPLYLVYLWLDQQRVSLKGLTRLHKSIILATLLLPLALFGYSQLADSSTYPSHLREPVVSGEVTLDSPRPQRAAPADPSAELPAFAERSPVGNAPMSSEDWVFFLVEYIGVMSLSGLLLLLFRLVKQAFRLRKLRSSGISSVVEGYEVVYSNTVAIPFAAGVLRPRIYLPRNLRRSQAQVMLQHELNHLRLKHHHWALLEIIQLHLFWFNPFLYSLHKRGILFRELECDAVTAASMDKYQYARLLVESAGVAATQRSGPLGVHSWTSRESLSQRIHQLVGPPRSKQRATIKLSLGVAIGLTLFLGWALGSVNGRFLEQQLLLSVQQQYEQSMQSRETVKIDLVPAHFIKALLVNEDRSFYRHDGLDLNSVLRASGTNLKSWLTGGPKYQSGGSTLSMQLGRSFLVDRERSIERKLKELKLARVLEKHFTKDEILEMYLNRVYFGEQAWGLAGAARTYFGHPYTELSEAESAMLVPFLQAPTIANLVVNPARAEANQQALLSRMAQVDIAR